MVDTQQPAAIAIVSTGLAISTIFIGLRIWARCIAWKDDQRLDRYIVWSDCLLLVAYALAAAETFAILKYTFYTWQGYHVADIPKISIDNQIIAQQYNLANQLLYNPILSLVRSSVILFLLRIGESKQIVKISLWIALALNIMLAIAIFFADAFQCTPFRYVFDYPAMDLIAQKLAGANSKGQVNGVTIKGGHCIDQIKFFLISAGLTVGVDILVVTIPSVLVWDLRMSRRKKAVAIGILSSGVLVTGISIARLVIYQWRFSPNNKDRTYGVGYTISSVEANLAVATGCVPLLGPLVHRLLPGLLGSNAMTPGERSTYSQQPDVVGEENHAMGSKLSGWKHAQNETEAWSSKERILSRPVEIHKAVRVDLTYSEAEDSGNASQSAS